MIITWNLRDFPIEIVAELGIAVHTPDQLVQGLLEENESAVLGAMKEHRCLACPTGMGMLPCRQFVALNERLPNRVTFCD